jgi:hypothetical protein
MVLAMLLLLASELATLSCGHRTLRADFAAWRPATTTTTAAARAAPAAAARDAEAAEFRESERLVPHGSNPLHN